jgi:hypothetical protein
MVAYLSSELCQVSGKIFSAGGGYYSRAAIIEGPGVFFDPEAKITPEMIAEQFEQISSVEGGREFGSAMEQTGHILSKMSV